MNIDVDGLTHNIIFPVKHKHVEIDKERMLYLEGFYAGRFQDKGYQPHFETVFKQLTGHCAYKYAELSKKGIMLVGGVGNGKTFAMQIISQMFNIDFYPALDISEFYKKHEEFPKPNMIFTNRAKWGRDIIIDDVGTEKTIVNYGERTEVINDFIQKRYREFKEKHAITYISTNLSREAFIKRYSERVWSRIDEMCLIIDMTNCRDLRKEL